MSISDHLREQKALYELDFGQPAETVFRIVGTSAGAGIIYLYTGWWYSWLWAAGFALVLGVYWLAHRYWAGRATAAVIRLFHVNILLSNIAFIWLPVRMIAANDVPLSLSGAAVLGCVYVFMLRQVDHDLKVVVAQFAILAIGSGIGIAPILLQMEMPMAMVGLAASWLAFNGYSFQIVLIVRKDQMDARLAAERSAQANKMEALGQMAGGVAHDFNNILTAAMGNLELAKVVSDPQERDRCLDQTHASLDRASLVIRELLQFARPATTGARAVSASALLAQVNTICANAVPNDVALRSDQSGDDVLLDIDADQFVTAILNLVINASHAAGKSGRITVAASLETIASGTIDMGGNAMRAGRYVQFSVTDDGPGIPPEIRDRIIDPFFTTKSAEQGTGLGLAMVYAFAQRARGGLFLDSQPGKTQFNLLLPARAGAPAESAAKVTRKSGAVPQVSR